MNKRYNKQFEAYYDADTREWLERPCRDPQCGFCVDRPLLAPPDLPPLPINTPTT